MLSTTSIIWVSRIRKILVSRIGSFYVMHPKWTPHQRMSIHTQLLRLQIGKIVHPWASGIFWTYQKWFEGTTAIMGPIAFFFLSRCFHPSWCRCGITSRWQGVSVDDEIPVSTLLMSNVTPLWQTNCRLISVCAGLGNRSSFEWGAQGFFFCWFAFVHGPHVR